MSADHRHKWQQTNTKTGLSKIHTQTGLVEFPHDQHTHTNAKTHIVVFVIDIIQMQREYTKI